MKAWSLYQAVLASFGNVLEAQILKLPQTYWIRNSRGRLRNLFYQALQVILMNMKI